MKKIVINQPKKVTIQDAAAPVRKKGEALLKIRYGGICGSDLGIYRGSFAYASYPRMPGHEFSAEIMEIDNNDLGLKRGMTVTANPYFNCGRCYSCRNGRINCCVNNQTMGVQREGAFCEYITMPIERIYEGRGIAPRTLAVVEPFCISYHGVKRAGIRRGDRVLIMGAGTIGVLAAVAAGFLGAEVYISDITPEKLNHLRQFGVNGFILNESPEKFAAEVEQITGGDGFDVTVEAVGLPATFKNCIDVAAFSGKVVVIGVGKTNLDFNYTMIQKKELSIFGSRNALKSDFEEIIGMVSSGRVPLDKVITNEYDWLDAERAWKEFHENAAAMRKVVLKF